MVVKFKKINNGGKVYQNCITFPIINECYSRSKMLGLIAVWDTVKSIEKTDGDEIYTEQYVEGTYKVSIKNKDGKKIFHLNPTDNLPNSLFIELVEENFHTNTYWEEPTTGEYVINELSSGGGYHSQFILTGFIPFGTKLKRHVDTYKRRNGSWQESYIVTPEGVAPYEGAITPEEIENI